ncbi:unnamed protein product [Phaeothamnion confervicola]
MDEESLRQDKAEYEQVKKDDWMPRHHLPLPAARRVRLNVGGQVFEVAEAVLRRDPHSLLAALCDDECPLKTDDDGVIYVDRDWWVFRTVLKFLRDGVVPEDRPLLTQVGDLLFYRLYITASTFNTFCLHYLIFFLRLPMK